MKTYMDKEIKLRAWNTKEKCMLYRKLFDMNWYHTEKNDDLGSHCWGAISGGQRNFLEIMQCTGLKDKNGKEIYEGDILKCRVMYDYDLFEAPVILKVEFHDGQFDPMCLTKMTKYRILPLYCDYEIIGNEKENPELLKK